MTTEMMITNINDNILPCEEDYDNVFEILSKRNKEELTAIYNEKCKKRFSENF